MVLVKHKSTRRVLLEEAIELIDGDRNRDYGAPGGDFATTAAFWQTYLERIFERRGRLVLQKHDVAIMIGLMKVSRLAWTPTKQDSWADLAGYSACGFECVTLDNTDG